MLKVKFRNKKGILNLFSEKKTNQNDLDYKNLQKLKKTTNRNGLDYKTLHNYNI